MDNLVTRGLALGEHQQVTGTQWQAAAVSEQITNRKFTRHPGVVHAEFGQVVDYRVVPIQFPLVCEQRQRRRRKRLGHGADLEQGGLIDRYGMIHVGDPQPLGEGFVFLQYADGDPGNVEFPQLGKVWFTQWQNPPF